jgi:hypothetical protein
VSDASLWVASFLLSTTAQQTSLPAVGHYTNGHWKLEDLPLPYQGVDTNLNVLSLAMVNDDEGWIAARLSDPQNTAGKSKAVLYHRLHGKWTIDTTIASDFDYFAQIVTTSPTDVWAIGQHVDATTNKLGILFYHYQHGKWESVPNHVESNGARRC